MAVMAIPTPIPANKFSAFQKDRFKMAKAINTPPIRIDKKMRNCSLPTAKELDKMLGKS